MKLSKYSLVFLCLMGLLGCDNFLDVRPSIKLVVPESLSDMEALLDHQDLYGTPTFNTLAGDEIYMDDSGFLTRSFVEQRIFTWEVELYDPTDNNYDWITAYRAIYIANTVLNIGDQLEPVTSQDMEHKNTLMGRAYFFRAYYHYALLETFSAPYNAQTASTDLGVPLKVDDEVQTVIPRSTVQEVYDQIESDLEQAYQLLPDSETRKYKASKRAVDAFKARMYLSMRRYDEALEHASRVVLQQPELLRYEELDATNDYPFELYNKEVVFHTENLSVGFINASTSYIKSAPMMKMIYVGCFSER